VRERRGEERERERERESLEMRKYELISREGN
jgi:hypothetical protein